MNEDYYTQESDIEQRNFNTSDQLFPQNEGPVDGSHHPETQQST